MARKKAFTLIELLVVVAIIALLISILLPSLSRAREITKRAVCASNIRGIGQATKVYSNDNADWYPTCLFKESSGVGSSSNVGWVGDMAAGMMTQVSSSGSGATFNAAVSWDRVHPSRCMFMLVIDGSCTAKQFICPSSGDSDDDLRNPPTSGGTGAVAAQPGINRFDFRGYPYESYGIQYPFGARGRPNENLDARAVIMADKGPYFIAGTVWPGTTAYPCYPDAEAKTGTAGQSEIGSGFPTADTDVLKLDTDKWRPYNSRNHTQEGQNCLYQDGHATFEKKPIVGVNFDNIYSFQAVSGGNNDPTLRASLVGCVPGAANGTTNSKGPFTNTDSVIVP
jgi:prepilin-type N-terminal cleavage/methylation domain-containing protein